jgi:hypothetical protein
MIGDIAGEKDGLQWVNGKGDLSDAEHSTKMDVRKDFWASEHSLVETL